MKFSFDSTDVLVYGKVDGESSGKNFRAVRARQLAMNAFDSFLLLPTALGGETSKLIEVVGVRLCSTPSADDPHRIGARLEVVLSDTDTNAKVELGFDIFDDLEKPMSSGDLASFIITRIRERALMCVVQKESALNRFRNLFEQKI